MLFATVLVCFFERVDPCVFFTTVTGSSGGIGSKSYGVGGAHNGLVHVSASHST